MPYIALIGLFLGAGSARAEPTYVIDQLEQLAHQAAQMGEDSERLFIQDQIAALDLSTEDFQACISECKEATARAWSAHALGHLPGSRNQGLLIESLMDTDELIRREAIEGLANIGDRGAIPALVRSAARETSTDLQELAQQAAEAIINRARNPEHTDTAPLQSEDPMERIAGLEALQHKQDWSLLPLFTAASNDTHPGVKRTAILALGSLGDDRALAILHPLLTNTSGPNQHAAIGSVAQLRNRTSVPHLLPLLESEDPLIRQYTVRALGWIPTEDSIAGLSACSRDSEEEVRTELILTLAKMTDFETGPILVLLLDDDSLFLRAEAARLLGETRYAEAADPLIDALKDSDPLVRINAASSLSILGELSAEAALRKSVSRAETPEEAVFYNKALENLGLMPEASSP